MSRSAPPAPTRLREIGDVIASCPVVACTWTPRVFHPGPTAETRAAVMQQASDLLWWHDHYVHRPAAAGQVAA